MARSIAHRGPDDEGFHFDGPLGLGFRRLSIIDLAGGHQPMADADESVWVVFNGEIYNFQELRRELEGARPCVPHALGHRGHRSRLQAVGHRGPESPQRHVRTGNLGRAPQAARRRARSRRHQARLLPDRQRSPGFRLRVARRARRTAAAPRHRPDGPQPVPALPLHAVAAHPLRWRPQAGARNDAGRREWLGSRRALVRPPAASACPRRSPTPRPPRSCSTSTSARSNGT